MSLNRRSFVKAVVLAGATSSLLHESKAALPQEHVQPTLPAASPKKIAAKVLQPLPPGEYTAVCAHAETFISKNGCETLKIRWRILDAPPETNSIYQAVPLSCETGRDAKQILSILSDSDPVTALCHPEELVGKPVVLRIVKIPSAPRQRITTIRRI